MLMHMHSHTRPRIFFSKSNTPSHTHSHSHTRTAACTHWAYMSARRNGNWAQMLTLLSLVFCSLYSSCFFAVYVHTWPAFSIVWMRLKYTRSFSPTRLSLLLSHSSVESLFCALDYSDAWIKMCRISNVHQVHYSFMAINFVRNQFQCGSFQYISHGCPERSKNIWWCVSFW